MVVPQSREWRVVLACSLLLNLLLLLGWGGQQAGLWSVREDGDWRDIADAALCSSSGDANAVLDALVDFDGQSNWFVLVG